MKKIIEKIRDRYDAYGIFAGFILPLFILLAVIVSLLKVTAGVKNENEYSPHGTRTTIFVDDETGVNYILYTGVRETSISVRYNADGTIYVSEKDNN